MKLNLIKSNMTELQIGDQSILFSYNTPVACVDRCTDKVYRTEKHWSVMTSRHINQYFRDVAKIPDTTAIEHKEQEWFDNLLLGVGVR